MAQISFPAGLVTHAREWRTLGHGSLPAEALAPQRADVVVYLDEMVRAGYVWFEAAHAARLSIGSPIHVDRTHATVAFIDEPQAVRTPDGDVRACKVLLADRRYV